MYIVCIDCIERIIFVIHKKYELENIDRINEDIFKESVLIETMANAPMLRKKGNKNLISYDEDLMEEMEILFRENYSYADELNIVFNEVEKAKRQVYITQYSKKYKNSLGEMLKTLSKQDKYFLALDYKMNAIKDCMRREKHLYVIVYEGNFAGYFRESGRPNGYSLLEELAILPEYRGKGLSVQALAFYKKLYPLNYAKTKKDNHIMNAILTKEGYKCTSESQILHWEYNGGSIR